MSSVLHPVGPERRTTYWRRRLVAVFVLLLLLVGAVLGVRALVPDSSAGAAAARLDPEGVAPTLTATAGPTASPTDGATATADPTASASATAAGAAPACAPGDLQLALTSPAAAYGPGVAPKFSLTVENVSQAACTAEVGSAVRTFTVEDATGGRVWSSADCQSSTSSKDAELAPGAARSMSTSWSRQRSAAGCPDDQPAAGAGTYTVQGTWDDVAAAPLTITLAG